MKRPAALLLMVCALAAVAWLLWADGGQSRRTRRDRALVSAVQKDDLAAAARLLGEGADPNAQTPPTSLGRKIHYYRRVVSGGAGVPSLGHLGDRGPHYSVLEIASMRGNVGMVSLLLSRGADASYKDRANGTAHRWALAAGGPFSRGPVGGRDYPRVIALLSASQQKKRAAPP